MTRRQSTTLLPLFYLLLLLPLAGQAVASQNQTAAPAQSAPPAQPVNVAELQQTLTQIEQMAQTASLDLAKLRIEKWKADSGTKRQSQSNADSLMSNLSAALPGMVASARSAPTALAPGLKLYRDLNVLYDVLSGLTESAGAFGTKDEYRGLAADDQALDSVRRSLGDYLENLASFKDAEIASLSTHTATNAGNAAVPKKIIDDTEPEKKPDKKKKKKAIMPAASPK